MRSRFTRFITFITAWALLAVPARTDEGDFWDFLQEALEHAQNNGWGNGWGESSTSHTGESLEDDIAASAEQCGETGDFSEYASKLALTLNMLSLEQQDRVFNGQ